VSTGGQAVGGRLGVPTATLSLAATQS